MPKSKMSWKSRWSPAANRHPPDSSGKMGGSTVICLTCPIPSSPLLRSYEYLPVFQILKGDPWIRAPSASQGYTLGLSPGTGPFPARWTDRQFMVNISNQTYQLTNPISHAHAPIYGPSTWCPSNPAKVDQLSMLAMCSKFRNIIILVVSPTAK